MIKDINDNEVVKEKTFNCVDNKTGEDFSRVVSKDSLELYHTISNTEAAFSDKTIVAFREWMKKKGYNKSDCWCKHIQEFVNDANS